MSHLSARVSGVFALCLSALFVAPQAAPAQAAPSPVAGLSFGFGPVHPAAVRIGFQIADVSTGQLARAERVARSLQPALPTDMDTPLRTGLSGLPEIWLHYELGKTSPPTALVDGPPMIAYEGVPATLAMAVTPHGDRSASATVYMTTETVHVQSDNKITVTLRWTTTYPASMEQPMKTTDMSTVTCTVLSGQPTVVAVPPASGHPERLIFLTASVEPSFSAPLTGHGLNTSPNVGTDQNSLDKMQTHSPDIHDRINILPPLIPSPIITPEGK